MLLARFNVNCLVAAFSLLSTGDTGIIVNVWSWMQRNTTKLPSYNELFWLPKITKTTWANKDECWNETNTNESGTKNALKRNKKVSKNNRKSEPKQTKWKWDFHWSLGNCFEKNESYVKFGEEWRTHSVTSSHETIQTWTSGKAWNKLQSHFQVDEVDDKRNGDENDSQAKPSHQSTTTWNIEDPRAMNQPSMIKHKTDIDSNEWMHSRPLSTFTTAVWRQQKTTTTRACLQWESERASKSTWVDKSVGTVKILTNTQSVWIKFKFASQKHEIQSKKLAAWKAASLAANVNKATLAPSVKS